MTHHIRLPAYDSIDLDRLSYSNGEIVADMTNNTVRLMDGTTPGGAKLATQPWVTNNALTLTTLNAALANYVSSTALTSFNYVTQTQLNTVSASIPAQYTLPTASTSILGGVKVDGTSITIDGNGVIHGANTYVLPQATTSQLGGVRVDGTTITVNNGVISGANTYVLPQASTITLGGVKVDGSTITINPTTGVISGAQLYTLPTASTSILGGVKVDGSTVTVNNGVISAVTSYSLPVAGTSTIGGVQIAGVTTSGIINSNGNIRIATATTSQLGGVKVDGTSISINNGVISTTITGTLVYKGTWNAQSNIPTLTNGSGTSGWEYIVSTSGTASFDGGSTFITFAVGDIAIYNGSTWNRIPLGAAAGTTNNYLTFDNLGAGSSSPISFNGTSAINISYNTIGAEPAGGSTGFTTAGTITTGVWHGSLITPTYGGTGVNNGTYTLTLTGGSRTLDQNVNNGASPIFNGANFTSIPNSALTNSTIIFGATSYALGSTVSSLDGINIGANTRGSGAFTTLSANNTVTLSPANSTVTLSPTGTGYVSINPATAGTINNMSIGTSTAAAGNFTSIGATTAGTGTFTTGVFTTLTYTDARDTIYTGGTTSGTITPNAANGNIQTITLTGSITINALASPVSGQSLTMLITQPASGGPYTLTSTMKFAGGNKTLSTSANAVDMLTISYIGTTYYASLVTGFA
jgi:hypothetical protein